MQNGGIPNSESVLRAQRPLRFYQCTPKGIDPFLPARAMPERYCALYCKLIRIKGKTSPFGLSHCPLLYPVQTFAHRREAFVPPFPVLGVCNFLRSLCAQSSGIRPDALPGAHLGFRRALVYPRRKSQGMDRVICAKCSVEGGNFALGYLPELPRRSRHSARWRVGDAQPRFPFWLA
jgi:hypothetical protein